VSDCDPNEVGSVEEEAPTTLCDRDRVNNVWIDGGNKETGEGGVCQLDTLREDQVVYVIQRDQRARADLLRVTSNEYLQELARTVPPLPQERPGDKLQQELNRNRPVKLYTEFKGIPPWNQ